MTTARSARRRSACWPSSSSAAVATSCPGRWRSDETWTLRLRRGRGVRRPAARTPPGTRLAWDDGVHLRARRRGRPCAHPTQGRRLPQTPARAGDRRGRLSDRGGRGANGRARHARRAEWFTDPDRRSRHVVGEDRVRPVCRRRRRSVAPRRRRRSGRDDDHRRPQASSTSSLRSRGRAASSPDGSRSNHCGRRRAGGRSCATTMCSPCSATPSFGRAGADRGARAGSPRRRRGNRGAVGRRPAAGVRPSVARARRPGEPDAHAARRRAGRGRCRRSRATAARTDGAGAAPEETPSLDDLEPRPGDTPTTRHRPPRHEPTAVASAGCPRSPPIPSRVTAAAGSTRRPAPSCTTTSTPTTCSSRTTRRHSSTTCATLVAKEYVVYNNPRADGDELAEELVRMLIRVRRHLPNRVRRR